MYYYYCGAEPVFFCKSFNSFFYRSGKTCPPSSIQVLNGTPGCSGFPRLTVQCPEETQLCSSVIQDGSSAPVSILHPSVPTSLPHTHCKPSQGNGLSKLLSKLRKKFRTAPVTDETREQMLPCTAYPDVDNFPGMPSKRLELDSMAHQSALQYSDNSKESSLNSSFTSKSSLHCSSKVPLADLPPARWCSTIPGRKSHRSYWLEGKDRPASLEIRRSSLENSSPLANYLSISCDFKNPDEVVLKKSKTRVKTPRHPPLPRISLNESNSR